MLLDVFLTLQRRDPYARIWLLLTFLHQNCNSYNFHLPATITSFSCNFLLICSSSTLVIGAYSCKIHGLHWIPSYRIRFCLHKWTLNKRSESNKRAHKIAWRINEYFYSQKKPYISLENLRQGLVKILFHLLYSSVIHDELCYKTLPLPHAHTIYK